jgi:ABC-type nitrate/sulfonate/bicarbonate transport system substrate-binding protein
MKHKRIAKGIAAAFLGASLLWGGQVLAQEDLRIPVAMTSTTTALVEQVAIYKGFFKDIGYNARVYSVSGGENAAVLALERGQLPFFGSDDNIPLAIRKGSNIRVIGSEMNVLPYWLVAGKHVKSYKDLPRPVKVGISSPTSGNVYVSLKLLEAAGIPTKDARLIKVGGSSARLAGVKGGKIDVGSLTFGMMLRAKKANLQILGAANQFVKEYAFLQLAMNKNYIKDGGSIPNRCQITESAIKAYIESAVWSKSIAADLKIPPAKDIMFPEFYNRALAWYNNKGWMKK